MKKVGFILTIIFCGMLMQTQAQKENIDKQFIGIQIFANEPDSVYKGHNYNYYYKEYKDAKAMKIFGMVVTTVGAGAFITGVVYMNINFDVGTPLITAGFVTANLGGAIWIYQTVRQKNNLDAMNEIKGKTSLSFRVTRNGVGLVLRF